MKRTVLFSRGEQIFQFCHLHGSIGLLFNDRLLLNRLLHSYNLHFFVFILASSVHRPLSPINVHRNLFNIHHPIYPGFNIPPSTFPLQPLNLCIIDIGSDAFLTDPIVVIPGAEKRLEE